MCQERIREVVEEAGKVYGAQRVQRQRTQINWIFSWSKLKTSAESGLLPFLLRLTDEVSFPRCDSCTWAAASQRTTHQASANND